MGTQKKTVRGSNFVAQTVKAVATLTDPVAARIMDRAQSIDEDFVRDLVDRSLMRWEGRNPEPALDENGNFQGTDLDLLSFLVPMVERGAVVELPRYENRRQSMRKENERKIGWNNFGSMTGLVSNQDVFSFSARLFDQTIVVRDPVTEKETTGAHRNYMLVDVDGYWYDGWHKIVFDPTAKENEFLTAHGLWTGNAVYFKHYVHPNRRQSIYGAPYLRLKLLSERLRDEASFFRGEVKRLEALGFKLPVGAKKAAVPVEKVGDSKSIKVGAMEMVLDGVSFAGEYQPVEDSVDGLVAAYEWQKLLTYTLRPLVQFVVRADEAAFYLYGAEELFVAPWMKGVEWELGYRLPRGRVDWNRLELAPGVALRYRIKSVSQKVAA